MPGPYGPPPAYGLDAILKGEALAAPARGTGNAERRRAATP
ncbi:hypothetical protein [Kitasatospora sp. GP82]|nr:hypothetical protein [Kitasatospora sp. GP82]MDH6124316.1 hypothetical protein [Kitasatospora sp. GP82]